MTDFKLMTKCQEHRVNAKPGKNILPSLDFFMKSIGCMPTRSAQFSCDIYKSPSFSLPGVAVTIINIGNPNPITEHSGSQNFIPYTASPWVFWKIPMSYWNRSVLKLG